MIFSAKSDTLEINKKLEILSTAGHMALLNDNDSLFLKSILARSDLFFRNSFIDSANYYDKLLVVEAKKRNSDFFMGKGFFNLGYYFKSKQQFDSAYYYYNLSKSTFERLNDFSQTGRRQLSMALIQKNQGDFYGAKETLTEAINNLEKTEDFRFLASAYNELGTNSNKLLNFEDAIENHEKAIALAKDKRDVFSYKNNLALVYQNLEKYSDAILILEKIVSDSALNKNTTTYARALHNLANNQWEKTGGINKEYFFTALKIRLLKKDYRGLLSSYYTLARVHVEEKPQVAKKYLDSLMLLSKQLKMPKSEIDALTLQMKLEPKNLAIRNRYILLSDSLYKNELKVKTQFAKMKYDDEQEKARLLTLESRTARNEVQLAQQETQKILYLSLSAILLMGGVSLYFLLRQRHKKEKLQEVYRTEQRISQDLHDGLGNSVFGLMTKVQTKNPNNEELLEGLETIYQATRTISHENAAINTKDFETELKNLIQSYQYKGTNIVTTGLSKIDWTKFEDAKRVAVHRAVNELLVNMKKHAKANLVSLKFETDKSELRFFYSDNGIGFDPVKPSGIGLKNTENRIRAVGGQFKFESEGTNGVKASISIPA